jgi:hypothetical protein
MNRAQQDRRKEIDDLQADIHQAHARIKKLQGRCRHTRVEISLYYTGYSPTYTRRCMVCDKPLGAACGGYETLDELEKSLRKNNPKAKFVRT